MKKQQRKQLRSIKSTFEKYNEVINSLKRKKCSTKNDDYEYGTPEICKTNVELDSNDNAPEDDEWESSFGYDDFNEENLINLSPFDESSEVVDSTETGEPCKQPSCSSDPYHILNTTKVILETSQSNANDFGSFNSTMKKDAFLYEGCTVTFIFLVLSVADICLSSQMSNENFRKLLELLFLVLKPLLKPEHRFPVDPKSFLNLITEMKYKENKYCYGCEIICDNSETNTCLNCKETLKRFYTNNIEDWFLQMVSNVGELNFLNLISKGLDSPNTDNITDFKDGTEYERLSQEFKIDQNLMHDLVLYFNFLTDGGNKYKTSSQSFWPIELILYNLPKWLRYEFDFTFIAGFASHKPKMFLFLRPMVDNFKTLFNRLCLKLINNTVYLRACLATVSSDRMACCDIAKHVTPCGYYNCTTCNKKGVRLDHRVVFPLTGTDCGFRTHAQIIACGREKEKTGDDYVKGVGGVSIFAELPYVDLSKLYTAEPLHDFMLGFLKKILKQLKIKLGPKWNDFNTLFSQQRYPNICHRQPKLIEFNKNKEVTGLKGLEFWNLFIYMYPLFKQFTENEFYVDHEKNQRSLYYFITNVAKFGNQIINPIAKKELYPLLNLAYSILADSVILFGMNHLTLVSHRLIHYPYFISWHGPVYLSSGFPIEDSIRRFTSAITGTNYVERKCLHSLLVQKQLHYVKRINGDVKMRFGIGNCRYVYNPVFGFALKVEKEGGPFQTCSRSKQPKRTAASSC